MRRKQSTFDQFREFMEEDQGIKVPMKWEICDRCRGNGTHTNPAIDGNGLPQEYVDDPDFMEEYMGGMYDILCEAGCDNGKILVPDEDHMSPEVKKQLDEWLRSEAETEAIYRMERMMGA